MLASIVLYMGICNIYLMFMLYIVHWLFFSYICCLIMHIVCTINVLKLVNV